MQRPSAVRAIRGNDVPRGDEMTSALWLFATGLKFFFYERERLALWESMWCDAKATYKQRRFQSY